MTKDSDKKGPVAYDKTRILVADDESTIRDLFKTILGFAFPDITIDQAENGLEAVKSFREKRQALLIMDMRMPEMDGMQAFLAIQDTCKDKNWMMPLVIFCTGFDPPQLLRDVIKDGSTHVVLRRPVTSDDIINTVSARLAKL